MSGSIIIEHFDFAANVNEEKKLILALSLFWSLDRANRKLRGQPFFCFTNRCTVCRLFASKVTAKFAIQTVRLALLRWAAFSPESDLTSPSTVRLLKVGYAF